MGGGGGGVLDDVLKTPPNTKKPCWTSALPEGSTEGLQEVI